MQQITVTRADFSRAVAIAGRTIERRNFAQVLSCLRLRASGDGLTISGTDMDNQIDYTVPGHGGGLPEDGIAIRDFRHIVRAAGAVGAESIEIGYDEASRTSLTANMGRLSFCGVAFPGNDFPTTLDTAERVAPIWSGTLTSEFLDALERVQPAISTEETHFYLNGVYFEKDADGGPWAFNLVATDGHRLHRATVQIPDAAGKIDATGGIIIPRKLVSLLLGMRPKKDGPAISMAIHPKYKPNDETATETLTESAVASVIRFKANGAVITGKHIDGTFPDYRRVIPSGHKLFATFNRAEMLRALGAMAALGGEKSCALKMDFAIGRVNLSRKWVDGSAEFPHVLCEVDGMDVMQTFPVAFNAHYLTAALNQFGTAEKVTMAWPDLGNASTSPCVIGSNESTGLDVTLMPMRV